MEGIYMNNCNISFPIHAFLILSYYFDKKNFSFSIFSNFFALSSPFSFRLQNFFFFSLVDLESWEYTFIFVICVKNFFSHLFLSDFYFILFSFLLLLRFHFIQQDSSFLHFSDENFSLGKRIFSVFNFPFLFQIQFL